MAERGELSSSVRITSSPHHPGSSRRLVSSACPVEQLATPPTRSDRPYGPAFVVPDASSVVIVIVIAADHRTVEGGRTPTWRLARAVDAGLAATHADTERIAVTGRNAPAAKARALRVRCRVTPR